MPLILTPANFVGFFTQNARNLLPLHSLMEMSMTVSKKIKQAISEFPDDFVFAVSDLDCDVSQREAAARALQRMAETGEIHDCRT